MDEKCYYKFGKNCNSSVGASQSTDILTVDAGVTSGSSGTAGEYTQFISVTRLITKSWYICNHVSGEFYPEMYVS